MSWYCMSSTAYAFEVLFIWHAEIFHVQHYPVKYILRKIYQHLN